MLGEPRVYTLRLDREHATTWLGERTSLTWQVDDLRCTTRHGYVLKQSDGRTLERTDGRTLGDGRTVGRSDSRTVGRSGGRTLGRSDSRTVGQSDGRTVGRSDGRGVGQSDGLISGRTDLGVGGETPRGGARGCGGDCEWIKGVRVAWGGRRDCEGSFFVCLI